MMLQNIKNWFRPKENIPIDPMLLRAFAAKSFAGPSFNVGVFENYIANGFLNISTWNAYRLYESAAPLATAITRISEAAALLDPIVKQGDEVVENSEALKVLKNPGFNTTYFELMSDFAVAYLLTNNAYAITDRFKRTIRVPKPFNITFNLNSGDGFISGYQVTTHNVGKMTTFSRDAKFNYLSPELSKLVHTKGETNNTGVEGRSPLQALFTELGQRIEGGKHNLSLLQNGLRASGLFSFKSKLTADQMGAINEQIELIKSGAGNAGVSLVLGDEGTFTELSKSNKDMDYKTVIQMANESVALRYKVPLPLITTSSQTRDNFSQSLMAFYDDAVFPAAEILLNGLTKLMELPDGQRFTFNKSEIPTIRKRRFEEADIKNKTNKFTTNEIRAEFNELPLEDGLGDEVLVPATFIPLAFVETQPEEDDVVVDTNETDDEEDNEEEE